MVGPLVVGDSVVGLSVEVGALVAGMVDGVGVGASVLVGLELMGVSVVGPLVVDDSVVGLSVEVGELVAWVVTVSERQCRLGSM